MEFSGVMNSQYLTCSNIMWGPHTSPVSIRYVIVFVGALLVLQGCGAHTGEFVFQLVDELDEAVEEELDKVSSHFCPFNTCNLF